VALTNYNHDYPSSKYLEESNFLIIKCDYLYAINSVEWQKNARLQTVVQDYLKFVDQYPKSEYLKEAESMYNNALSLQKNLTKS
jgi:outer membrane protein assembly factor BamD